MIRKTLLPLFVALALVLSVAPPASAATTLPTSMAALGDSVSQAMNSCGKYDNCPANSWSTGTSATVKSHALRLKTAGATGLKTYNDSVSATASADLLRQATLAVTQKPQYVTIESGANDACTTTVAKMTPVSTYESNVKSALKKLSTDLPNTTIFVASVPNLKTLWSVNKGNALARLTWSAAQICPSMLASPTDTSAAATTRRNTVQQRVVDYNAALARACASTPKCTFDGNAVYNYTFTTKEISVQDYFHPSVAGQAKLAAVTWPVSPYGKP
ncbi:SGNH/GDSL hydrolase family protein [Microbacteriaceae bacterium VKM Ac-2855]|nr:SGNH/GDSL hydrolase family protein [Microbacteriaceae bacterium VKM Ac-2855]